MHRVLLLSACLLVVAPSGITGQQTQPPSVGDRIRLTHSCAPKERLGGQGMLEICRRDVGILAAIATDSVVLTRKGKRALSASVLSLKAVETSQGMTGRKTSAFRVVGGSVLGLVVGFCVGALIGHVALDGPNCEDCYGSWLIGIPGAGLGAIGGGVIGYRSKIPAERWELVPLPVVRGR